MKPPDLAGVYAPILTPYTPGGDTIDEASFLAHMDHLQTAGLTGILVLGTNGEFSTLSLEEKIRLVDLAISHRGNLRILVGTTMPDSPSATLHFSQELGEYGEEIDGLLVAPPYYDICRAGGQVSEGEIIRFYRTLTGVVSQTPLLLYNVPVPSSGRATTPISNRIVSALAGVDSIIGVKDSTGDVSNVSDFLSIRSDYQVLVGHDRAVAAGLACGAVGSITAAANVFPEDVLAVYQADDMDTRSRAQQNLDALRQILESVDGKMVAIQKLLAYHLNLVPVPSPVRNRDEELSPVERERVLGQYRQFTGRSED